MHRTIVVAASHWQPLRDAFALGVTLARPRGAEVLIARVEIGVTHPAPELDALRESAPSDVPVGAVVVTAGSVEGGLHDVVRERRADMLVLGSSHLRTAKRTVRGGFAIQAIRDAPCTVAVAPQGYASHEHHVPQVIGVAWDDSPEAAEALEWAVQLAERTGGRLRIIHVVAQFEAHFAADARLEELRRAAEGRAPATVDVIVGDPTGELVGFAGVDLLVMGSRAGGALRRVAVGSVSSEVLHQAPVPVVILPRGVRAPVETTA